MLEDDFIVENMIFGVGVDCGEFKIIKLRLFVIGLFVS